MNYLNKTENLLKSCLKGKRKITTGTVVAFLIMGISAFSADSNGKLTINGSTSGIKDGVYTVTNEILNNHSSVEISKGESGTLDKVIFDKDLNKKTSAVEKEYYITSTNVDIENNGTIEITSSETAANKKDEGIIKFSASEEGEYSIKNAGTLKGLVSSTNKRINSGIRVTTVSGSTVNIENTGNILGDMVAVDKNQSPSPTTAMGGGIVVSGAGNINITSSGNIGLTPAKDAESGDSYLTNGIDVNTTGDEESIIKIENTGNIVGAMSPQDSGKNPKGIKLNAKNDNIIITNSGLIEAKILQGNDIQRNATGLHLDSENSEIKITNDGTIKGTTILDADSTSGGAFGILVSGKDNNFTLTNNNTIESSGTAVSFDINVTKDTRGSYTIINNENGVIKGGNFGISVARDNSASPVLDSSDEVTIINNGKIEAEKVGISVSNLDFDVTNNGNIVVNSNEEGAVKGVQINGNSSGKFTNEGNIILGEDVKGGVGISLGNNKNIEAVNNGTIELKGENSGSVAINAGTAKATNNGTIKVDKNKDDISLDELFAGNVVNKGTVLDKKDNAVFDKETSISGDYTTDEINSMEENGKNIYLTTGNLTQGKENLKVEALNIYGNTTVKNNQNNEGVTAEGTTINFDKNGKLIIGEENNAGEFILNNGQINGLVDKNVTNIEFGDEDSTLVLNNSKLNKVIVGNSGDKKGNINVIGNTYISEGIINTELNIGDEKQSLETSVKTNFAKVDIKTKFTDNINIGANGSLVLDVDSTNKYDNALKNSSNITVTGSNNDDIVLNTSEFNEKETEIDLGNGNTFENVDVTTISGDGGLFAVDDSKLASDKKVTVTFNEDLYKENGALNEIHKHSISVNNYFEQKDLNERERQYDKLYSSNIYSETVKVAYDNTKLVEDSILSLDTDTVAGKWTANGKALYSKNEYDRTGTLGDYSSDIESTGLLASLEYGLNDTTSVGFAFAGVKQDLDSDGGSADGDVFYFGAFGNKEMGSYKLTVGLGYQLGKYEADNTAASISSNDKYDSNAFSAYIQGKRIVKVEEGLTFEPKLKFGYTYIDQDDVKDDYFRLKDAELSTFNAEFGFDVVKTVQFDKSKLDVVFGASYVRAMGDTDNKFTGSFAGNSGTFDILGAELDENTVKFNLTGEVMSENGFFYNGGFTYRFGGEDTKDYGVNVGVGYSF